MNNFHLIIKRNLLLRSLAPAQNIVERRGIIPILSNVLLIANNNSLRIIATDMDLLIDHEISANIYQEGQITVLAHTLYDIIRKLTAEEVELKLNQEEKRLIIEADNCKFALAYLISDDFPIIKAGDMLYSFMIPCSLLIKMIDKNKVFMSNEETRYNLNGIYFHSLADQQLLRAVATDGHRLSRVEVELPKEAIGMPGVIIPKKTIIELRKLIDNRDELIKISLAENKISFSLGGILLISKLIDGIFPDYEPLIPYNNDKQVLVNTEHFARAVDRISIINFDKSKSVSLTILNDLLTISAVGESTGSASEQLVVDYNNSQVIKVGFNARYLLEIMSNIKGKMTKFLFSNDNYAPTLVLDSDDQQTLYVLMPMLI